MALLNDRDILLLLWHYWNIAGVCNILCTVVSMYPQQSSSDFCHMLLSWFCKCSYTVVAL